MKKKAFSSNDLCYSGYKAAIVGMNLSRVELWVQNARNVAFQNARVLPEGKPVCANRGVTQTTRFSRNRDECSSDNLLIAKAVQVCSEFRQLNVLVCRDCSWPCARLLSGPRFPLLGYSCSAIFDVPHSLLFLGLYVPARFNDALCR